MSLFFQTVNAQQSTTSSGGEAIGVGGTSSYSVGQIVYTTNLGTNGNIAQGVQQAFEISTTISLEETYYEIEDPDGYSNLRKTPGGDIIKKVYEGEMFTVLGEKGKYKKVELEDGTIGYIHSSRVVKSLE